MAGGFYYPFVVLTILTSGYQPFSACNAEDKYISSDEPAIMSGRAIWLDNCEGCHGYGVADAPMPMYPDEWQFRLAKGKDTLYQHAINGYIGPDYSMMPARGGNKNLKDEEVKLAVDYMVFLAGYYINKRDMKQEDYDDSTTN